MIYSAYSLHPPYPHDIQGNPLCPRCRIVLDYQAMRELDSPLTYFWASCRSCKRTTGALPMPRELGLEKLTAIMREEHE